LKIGVVELNKIIIYIISILIITGCPVSEKKNEEVKVDSFSFEELMLAPEVEIPPLQFLQASDNTKLAYRAYIPETIDAVLIFYHGGGAYSKAGYQHLGDGLSKGFNCLVVTPDIRGHGDSDGARGDTPTVRQVFDDISVLINYMKEKYPQKPLLLGGHSSGCGLILNYSSYKKKEESDGYLFLSPLLGYRAKAEKKDNPNPFATVKKDLFIQNAMSGTEGNTPAVFFNYSEEILQNTKNISSVTVNMSNALTPTVPLKQIKGLDLPTAVWIGEKEELIDVDKVVNIFTKHSPGTYTKIIKEEKHLSILVNAADHMGKWIHKNLLAEEVRKEKLSE
jgi:acylglycerol lipase